MLAMASLSSLAGAVGREAPSLLAQDSSRFCSRRQLVLGPCLSTVTSGFMSGLSFAVDRQRIDQLKETIQEDVVKRQYYVTGNLTRNIYSPSCRFIDPTTDVVGVEKYTAAVASLFDPDASKHELISIQVKGPSSIEAKWRLEGYLKFPWKPHIEPYEGTTVYTVNDDGLIVSHEETWNISLFQAFLEFVTPSFN